MPNRRRTLFQHAGPTPIIPISAKILGIFISLILLSNFMTNFISLQMSQRQIVNLTNTVLVDRLKELYTNAGNQYQLSAFSGSSSEALRALESTAARGFSLPNSIALGVSRDGKVLFSACANPKVRANEWQDRAALEGLNAAFGAGLREGSVQFSSGAGEYFGVYKYQEDWQCYLVRAELRADTQKDAYRVLGAIALVILGLTLAFLVVGVLVFNRLFASIKRINQSLYEMQATSTLSEIDISNAPNDDITYLAASFNTLSASINNLLGIFQKFVSKDVVAKAYAEHSIALEGNQRELTILFSDIKGFTYRTETLGNEIIDLLNVHYNRAIHCVHEREGVIGSIIGDAILAVFGTQEAGALKSAEAVRAAWEITNVTDGLRKKMVARRAEIERTRALTEAELRVYDAVLLEVGVGIDGGTVFYGNIGSDEHMANTVIGDNVNSSSRLEGLTRVYHLPIVVSEYIKDETLAVTERYRFYEIDTVQVKGKTEGKRIYFPFDAERLGEAREQKFRLYEKGLEAYYRGDWDAARGEFGQCGIEAARVFLERMGTDKAPKDWSGIWKMTTK
jgi:class 3 adenylate cyclase